jgi:hypothetical protein
LKNVNRKKFLIISRSDAEAQRKKFSLRVPAAQRDIMYYFEIINYIYKQIAKNGLKHSDKTRFFFLGVPGTFAPWREHLHPIISI